MSVLEVKNIKKTFGKTEVLKGVSFNLEKGERIVITGGLVNGTSGNTNMIKVEAV